MFDDDDGTAYEELHTTHMTITSKLLPCLLVFRRLTASVGPLCRSIRISRARIVHAEHSRNKYTLAIHAKSTFHNTNRDLIGFWRVPRALPYIKNEKANVNDILESAMHRIRFTLTHFVDREPVRRFVSGKSHVTQNPPRAPKPDAMKAFYADVSDVSIVQ